MLSGYTTSSGSFGPASQVRAGSVAPQICWWSRLWFNLLSGSASRRGAYQQQASFVVCLGNGREHLVGEVV
jgi:hypothetical protein